MSGHLHDKRDMHSIIFSTRKEMLRNYQLYLLVLLPVTYIIIFHYVPMYGIQIAFRDYRVVDGFFGSPWVGLKHFISTVVMAGVIIQFLSLRYGIVNVLLRSLGGKGIMFMGTPGLFSSIYVWSGVWQEMGWGPIIYLSALSAVDPSLHEAATVDGASRFNGSDVLFWWCADVLSGDWFYDHC